MASIILKSPEEIEKIAAAGKIVADVLLKIKESGKPGVTTSDLEKVAVEWIRKHKAKPAFLGYRGFPKSLCVSVNEEVVHGIPGKRILKEGDIVGLDCAVIYDDFVADSAMTVPVGVVSERAKKIMKITEECLYRGIDQVVSGNRIGDIGHAVQKHAEAHGYGVVRDFVGHGVGKAMHEEPQVPNYGEAGTGKRISPGMVIAIEPMINEGTEVVDVLSDKWTVVTRDKKLSAHFEHTVVCTEEGPRILTLL